MRNAVLARSGCDLQTIDELSRAFRAIWSSALEWGKRHRLEQVATLNYSLDDDCLTLIVKDECGWLDRPDQPGGDVLYGLVPAGLFDHVLTDRKRRTVELVKRFTTN